MIKITYSIGLSSLLLLSGCAPTASIVGTNYQPIHYTYAAGYNPPQVAYPDVPVDANTSLDSEAIVQQEYAINEMNDSIAAAQQQNEATQASVMLQLNTVTVTHIP